MEVARLILLGDCEEVMNLGKGWGENLGGGENVRDGGKDSGAMDPTHLRGLEKCGIGSC